MNKFHCKAAIMGLMLVPVFLLQGCAYFNTFYNARKAYATSLSFRESLPDPDDPPGPQERTQLETVIEKCGKVISLYPGSKWVDDALLLMGKAYLRTGIHDDAYRKFKELVTYYPESQFSSEAHYLMGLIHFRKDEYYEARRSFNRVIGFPDPGKWKREALFMVGRSFSAEGIHSEARTIFSDLAAEYPDTDLALQGRFYTGHSWLEEGEYEKAIDTFDLILSDDPGRKMTFDALFETGRCYHLTGEIDSALAIYNRLLEREEYFKENASVLFEMGELHEQTGDYEEALELYDQISNQYPGTHLSAEAWYEKGYIFLDRFEDYEKAKEAFDSIRKENAGDSLAVPAGEVAESLNELERLEEKIDGGDEDEVRQARFQLAELFLLKMGKNEKALEQFRSIVRDDPSSPSSLQARLAMAWIYENRLDSATAADSLYSEVVVIDPESEFGEIAAFKLKKKRESREEKPPGIIPE